MYYVGLVPSHFYSVIGKKDVGDFYRVLIFAFSLIFSVAMVSSDCVLFYISIIYLLQLRMMIKMLS
jgi:hypothetical protein